MNNVKNKHSMKRILEEIINRNTEGNYLLSSSDKAKMISEILDLFAVSGSLPIERFDAEDWLGEKKDIWNHPIITDRNGLESYEVADLMAEFANSVISNERQRWWYG